MDSYILLVLFVSAVCASQSNVLQSSYHAEPSKSASHTAHVTPSLSFSQEILPTSQQDKPTSSAHSSATHTSQKTSSAHHSSSHHASLHPSAHSSAAPTSSHVPPTTTPEPTTTPQPVASFDLKKDGKVCEKIQGKISVHIDFAESLKHNSTSVELVNDGSTVSGHCLDKTNTSMMEVEWKGLLVVFYIKVEDGAWFLSQLHVNFTSLNASAMGNYSMGSNDQLYQAHGNMSYECMREKMLMLESHNKEQYNITVDFHTIQINPYGDNFNDSMKCPAKTNEDTTSSIVPIAVGCALAGLIVIVLIAYLIGRRKNNAGYQQV